MTCDRFPALHWLRIAKAYDDYIERARAFERSGMLRCP